MVLTAIADQPSTWDEMVAEMRHRHLDKMGEERLGQAYFNALGIAWPELAELVRGTMADPFYAESFDDIRMIRFFDMIVPYFI